ncbi:MAG: alpha/beta hydrolase [Bacteroidales bacterium]
MRKHQYIIIACLLFSVSIFAQGGEVIQEEKTYKTIDGKTLKVYVFSTAETKHKPLNPAIVFFHGGGWAYGSPSEFFGACERFAKQGFITFSCQYRLSITDDLIVPHPEITPVESVKDARSAMRWIRGNATLFNIDPGKIVAGGQSAGGQLALSTAMIENVNEASDNLDISPIPNAILLFSSSVNMLEAWADMLLGDRREEIWSISPHHHVKAGLPPIIAFHGTEDCMVPFWVVNSFKEKTTSLGNYFELIAIEGRKHYLGEGNEKYATYFDEEILEKTDEFLKRFGFLNSSQ